MKDTLTLFNNSLAPGNFRAANSLGAAGVAYDSGKGELFVANEESNNVSVVNDTSHDVVAMVTVGTSPVTVAYDNATGQVFVLNQGSDNVSVISDATNRVIATVAVGTYPSSLAYDSGKREVFVSNMDSNSVSVISDATDQVVATVAVGTCPEGMAYDSGKGELFVANFASANVSVISDTKDLVVSTVVVQNYSSSVAYDAVKGEVFVANENTNNVSVINDTTDQVVEILGVGAASAWNVAYDSGKGQVFVADSDTNDVSVISDATDQVVALVAVGSSPDALAYDHAKGEVFVTNLDSNNVSVINDTTDVVVATVAAGPYPSDLAYDNRTGQVFVANSASDIVSVINDTTDQVVRSIAVGDSPADVEYDSGTGQVFVSNQFSDNVSVILDATDQVVASIAVKGDPSGIAYDSSNGDLYVGVSPVYTYPLPINVTVINDTTDEVIAVVPFEETNEPDEDLSLTFDSAKGEVFVADDDDYNLSIINDATNQVVATETFASGPSGVAYDSGKDEVFVAAGTWVSVINGSTNLVVGQVAVENLLPVAIACDSAKGVVFVSYYVTTGIELSYLVPTGVVSVINDTTGRLVALVAVGNYPDGLAYDSGKGEIFVANAGSDDLSVIDDTTNQVVATIELGTYPYAVAYDSGKGEIFVANYDSNEVSVINAVTGTVVASVPVGEEPSALAYDSGQGEIFVANYGSSEVTIINDTTNQVVAWVGVGLGPTGVAYDSGKGEIFVANYAEDFVSVINDTTDQVVATVGLGLLNRGVDVAYDGGDGEILVTTDNPSYDDGNVTAISDVTDKVVWTTTIDSDAGSIAYDSGKGEAFAVGEPLPGFAFVYPCLDTIDIATNQVVWSTEFWSLSGVAYGSGRSDIFTADGGSDDVSVISDATNNVTATVAVGDWPVALAYDSRNQNLYVANEYQGTLSIVSTASRYTVTFRESGLASGTSWSVDLNGTLSTSTSSTINFTETNGTYPFVVAPVDGYTPAPASGNVTVSGANQTVDVAFTAPPDTYLITFKETGLPSGSTWSVDLGGSQGISISPDITFTEPNGTYPFAVSPVGGYTPGPASGHVTVSGAGQLVPVTFSIPGMYLVTFEEDGLPPWTSWSVDLSGTPDTSTSPDIDFNEPNGTYPFSVDYVDGFDPNPDSGSVTVDGADQYVAVNFTAPPDTYNVSFTEAGLPQNTSWTVDLGDDEGSSNSSTIVFAEPNGDYDFTVESELDDYTPTPATGTVTVDNADQAVSVRFDRTYVVSFMATGSWGTPWGVTLNNTTGSGVWSTQSLFRPSYVNFTEPNGSYSYWTTSMGGYWVTPSGGDVTVSGAPVSIALTVMKVYFVVFSEAIYIKGTDWSITLTGGFIVAPAVSLGTDSVTQWSDGASTIGFNVSNGTYTYSTYARGYPNITGIVTVDGQSPPPVTLALPPSVIQSSSGSPIVDYELIGVGVILLVTWVAVWPMRNRRQGHP